MKLLDQLCARARRAGRLRQARAQIRRAERAVAKRQRAMKPGDGDEATSDLLLIGGIALGTLALVMGLSETGGAGLLTAWLDALVAMWAAA